MRKSGFWNLSGAAWTPSTDWYWGITAAHTGNGPAYNYGGQIVMNGTGTQGAYFRTISGGTPTTWKRFWTSDDFAISSYVPTSRTVNGHALTGNVTVTKGDVGLGSVDNTADAAKSVNYATSAGSAPANGGNSDTVDSQHFSYTNSSNSPTYLWATNISGTNFLATRASISVNFATTAGSAPANGGTAAAVTINYNNDSNSTYQMLWGSVNGVYGTAGIYCNPFIDYVYAANFQLTSDRALKKKIKNIPISPIKAKYKQFVMKDNPDQIRYGIIAQDLQKDNPELVSKGADGMLTVSYIDLLIKEIASLKARVEELEKKCK
jgi:hypothetical protein